MKFFRRLVVLVFVLVIGAVIFDSPAVLAAGKPPAITPVSGLRLVVETDSDPDTMVFHVSELINAGRADEEHDLPAPDYSGTRGYIPRQHRLAADLLKIEGVEHLTLKIHAVKIRKGRVFTWKELRPQVEVILRKYLDKK